MPRIPKNDRISSFSWGKICRNFSDEWGKFRILRKIHRIPQKMRNFLLLWEKYAEISQMNGENFAS